jgi:hypothetical protein
MNTPTPRTDTEHAQFPMGGFTLDFARQLERELAAVTKERDDLLRVIKMTPLDLHPADGQGLCLCSQCEFRISVESLLASLGGEKP